MKKGKIVTLDINSMSNYGYGIARADDGRVIFVNGAVDGDRVEAMIIKNAPSFYVARLERILESSPYRDSNDFCSVPESCGGCSYRHVMYERELYLKREYVRNAFIKAGLPDVEVGEIRTTGKTSGYRNKAQYPVSSNSKIGLYAGFYAPKTHHVVPGSRCALQPDIFAEINEAICKYAENNGVSAYNEIRDSGVLRHIYIRVASGTGEIMVCPVLRHRCAVFGEEFVKMLTKKFPQIVSIMLNYNRERTNVIVGDEFTCIFGRDYIEDIMCGLRFRIRPSSFWQVNHDAAEMLYSLCAERAAFKGNECVLDLYCGTGSIGLSMAKNVGRIIGIEIVPEAVQCAKENAEINGIENSEFYCGDASDTQGILGNAEKERGEKINADLVILDPPRKGSTPELISYIAERDIARVLYVSCNPDTLARDCVEFSKHGYTIDGEVTPVDMFPRTGHVESVVCLTRSDKAT